MIDIISLRIKELRKSKNMTQKEFSEAMQVDSSQLSKIEQGKLMPTINHLMELSTNFKVSMDWLTGMTENSGVIADGLHIMGNRKTSDGLIQVQEVPIYDFEATAGLQALFDSGQPHRILETIKIPNLPRCDGALPVTGDSMYPLLKSGDIVLYKKTTVDSIFFGEMYLLSVKIDDWEEYVTVKYVQKSEKGELYVKLVSQNQHHQPKDVKLEHISAIAMVKASIRFNTMS